MSEEPTKAQPAAQAGPPGEAAAVGSEVGGVHSNDDLNWLDLWALYPQTRAYLKSVRRDATYPHAQQRSEGAGHGSQEITTPQKLRKLQRALYRKAGLPDSTYAAFCEAIEALREGGFVGSPRGATNLKRRMVERVLTRCAEQSLGDIEPLLTLLRRFAAEAAREEARMFCDDLVADDAIAPPFEPARAAA